MGNDTVDVQFLRKLEEPVHPPKPLHRVFWTRAGHSVILDMGFFDPVETRNVIRSLESDGEQKALPFHVTDRFFLQPEDARDLAKAFNDLVSNLEADGLIERDGTDGEGE